MSMQEHGKPRVKKLGAVGRKPVALDGEAVRFEELRPETPMPVVVRPAAPPEFIFAGGGRPTRPAVESHLLARGAILFRDFGVGTAAHFDEFIRAVTDEPAEYQEPATPRTHVGG